jgi:hypothetical protein
MKEFYVKVTSDGSLQHFPDNKPSFFSNTLASPLQVSNFEVGLVDVLIPYSYNVITEENNKFGFKIGRNTNNEKVESQGDEPVSEYLGFIPTNPASRFREAYQAHIQRENERRAIKERQEILMQELQASIERETTRLEIEQMRHKLEDLENNIITKMDNYKADLDYIQQQLNEARQTITALKLDFLEPDKVYAMPGNVYQNMLISINEGNRIKEKVAHYEQKLASLETEAKNLLSERGQSNKNVTALRQVLTLFAQQYKAAEESTLSLAERRRALESLYAERFAALDNLESNREANYEMKRNELQEEYNQRLNELDIQIANTKRSKNEYERLKTISEERLNSAIDREVHTSNTLQKAQALMKEVNTIQNQINQKQAEIEEKELQLQERIKTDCINEEPVVLDSNSYTNAEIPVGYYKDVQSVLEAILEKIPLDQRSNFKLEFKPHRNRVYVTLKNGASIRWKSDRGATFLGRTLGFDLSSQLELTKNSIAKYEADLQGGRDLLCIYCNLISPQHVGSVTVPLMEIVPNTVQRGEYINKHFSNPYYYEVNRSIITTISIQITDIAGETVHFEWGRVILTFHFREITK